MSRVHQETGHYGGEMERVLGTVRVEHLERDSINYRDRDFDDRRDRCLLETNRVALLDRRRNASPVQ